MSYSKKIEKITNINDNHRSDGRELIPAEVQAKLDHNEIEIIGDAAGEGYTVDDENLINNYAIEPKIYPSKYPKLEQQRRYIFLGIAALLLVITLILISLKIS
jgi:hypothetical protein